MGLWFRVWGESDILGIGIAVSESTLILLMTILINGFTPDSPARTPL